MNKTITDAVAILLITNLQFFSCCMIIVYLGRLLYADQSWCVLFKNFALQHDQWLLPKTCPKPPLPFYWDAGKMCLVCRFQGSDR